MNNQNLYQAPASTLADVAPVGDLEAADRGTRLVAVLLDSLIAGGLAGVVMALVIPAALAMGQSGRGKEAMPWIFFGTMVLALLPLLIWNLVWLHKYGQTIGKRIMRIRIVRYDTTRASLPRLFFLRWLLPGIIGAIPLLGFLFSLADACFIFRDDRRCIHDLIADTVVVKL